MPSMGIGFVAGVYFKRQNRFLIYIPGITHNGFNGNRTLQQVLVEEKAARPSISFKEIEVPHLVETIYYPGRPDWKPLKVTLYDVANNNPVWNWINRNYDVKENSLNYYGSMQYANNILEEGKFKRNINIYMLDGCGNAIESWTYENAYPSEIEYGDTDMSTSETMKITLTLRYDRAYWQPCDNQMIELVKSYMFQN